MPKDSWARSKVCHSWSRQVDNKGCMYVYIYKYILYIVYRILYMYRSVPTSVYAAESNGDSRPKLDLSAVAFRSPGQVIKDLCDFCDQWSLPCVVLHFFSLRCLPCPNWTFLRLIAFWTRWSKSSVITPYDWDQLLLPCVLFPLFWFHWLSSHIWLHYYTNTVRELALRLSVIG